jgi:hypothetical protein
VRRARIAVLGGLIVAALTACSMSVRGAPSPAEVGAAAASSGPSSSAPHTGLPGGAQPTCLVADGCGEDDTDAATPVGLVCSPLAQAMAGFDATAGARYPGGSLPTTGGSAAWSQVRDLVGEVVDDCGFQVMVDVADQYPDPLYTWLVQTAISALGEIAALPEGLRCAELQAMGLGPKQAVDYWFLWDGPALMDADADGIPCETVWPDIAQYMPATY